MIAHDYRTQIRRLIDDAKEGDSTALDHALRLAVRSGDRPAQLHLVGLKIRAQGAEDCRFVIDGKEDNGLRIPKALDPVSAFSVTLCWDASIARLFAADCAEHVLHIYEREYPGDLRPRKAIEVARAFARGEATREELPAARAAARAAATAATRTATEATWRASRAGAWAAAEDSARAGAWAAEREWQLNRILEYLLREVAP